MKVENFEGRKLLMSQILELEIEYDEIESKISFITMQKIVEGKKLFNSRSVKQNRQSNYCGKQVPSQIEKCSLAD